MLQAHFNRIDEAYDLFYKDLLRQGQLPLKDTGIGYWGISSAREVFSLFHKINLSQYKNFIDIGAGDFKVVFIASLFTQAHGIEFDPWLVKHAQTVRSRLVHIPAVNKASVMEGNFMQHDLSGYDVVFWHPDQKTIALDRKLSSEISGKLIVHGPHFHPDGFSQKEIHNIDGTYMYVFSK